MNIPEAKPGYRVFIVEDNELYARVLKKKLVNKQYEVSVFYTGRDCLNNLDLKPAIVTLDYRLPDIPGDELLAAIVKADPSVHVIIISGQDEIDTAIRLLKAGAYDYISKGPDTLEKLTHTIRNIHSTDLLRMENEILKSAIKDKYNFQNLIKGKSREIEQVFELMERAIQTNISVSVSGETGTGKELVAKGIHYNSKRKI